MCIRDRVKTGQKIGSSDAFVSAAIFSSVDGEVIAIEPRPYFTGTNVNSVVIKVDSEQEEPQWKDNDIDKVSVDQIKEYILSLIHI